MKIFSDCPVGSAAGMVPPDLPGLSLSAVGIAIPSD
jgi:hypothetical protein